MVALNLARMKRAISRSIALQLRDEGWTITPPAIEAADLDALTTELASCSDAGNPRGGTRHLLDFPSVQELARSKPVRDVAEAALGKQCFAVRGILFDKTPDANWKVSWHQDLTIAVRERRDVEGFGPWSVKEGVPHVQPPTSILERMIAVRVHLDECGPENGPVRVIPRSHTSGRLTADEIDAMKAVRTPFECTVHRGGILAFHLLILHSSSPSVRPDHRRVVHLEFATDRLPNELEWYHEVGSSSFRGSA